jgi:hypothetical protein
MNLKARFQVHDTAHEKLIHDLFRLFAKVLLAPRPFAMCLMMLKFCSISEEYCLLYFLERLSLGGVS